MIHKPDNNFGSVCSHVVHIMPKEKIKQNQTQSNLSIINTNCSTIKIRRVGLFLLRDAVKACVIYNANERFYIESYPKI